jgi:membrane protease YdiL (CAAX protease family)
VPEYSIPRRIWRAVYPSLIYIGVSFAVAFIVGVGYSVYFFASGNADITAPAEAAEAMTEWMTAFMNSYAMPIQLATVIVASVIFIPMWNKTRKTYARFTGGKTEPGTALIVAGLGAGLYFIISMLIAMTGIYEYFPSYEIVEDVLASGSVPLRIAAIALAGPVAEELCFRGITFGRLSGMRVWLAVIVQAALFGFVHLNPLQGIYAFVLGAIFGFVYARLRSLWYPIIMHVMFNLCGVLLPELPGIDTIPAFAFLLPAVVLTCVCSVLRLRRGAVELADRPCDEQGRD